MLLAAKGSQKLPGATSAGRAGTSIPDFRPPELQGAEACCFQAAQFAQFRVICCRGSRKLIRLELVESPPGAPRAGGSLPLLQSEWLPPRQNEFQILSGHRRIVFYTRKIETHPQACSIFLCVNEELENPANTNHIPVRTESQGPGRPLLQRKAGGRVGWEPSRGP